MQAISLLACTPAPFDTAIDLFFDFVEIQVRTIYPGMIQSRTMQNYDLTLVKLISKHWSSLKGWNVQGPLERIRILQQHWDTRNEILSPRGTWLRVHRRDPALLFYESYKMLRNIQKRRGAEILAFKVATHPVSLELAYWAVSASAMNLRARRRSRFF